MTPKAHQPSHSLDSGFLCKAIIADPWNWVYFILCAPPPPAPTHWHFNFSFYFPPFKAPAFYQKGWLSFTMACVWDSKAWLALRGVLEGPVFLHVIVASACSKPSQSGSVFPGVPHGCDFNWASSEQRVGSFCGVLCSVSFSLVTINPS